MTLYYIMPKTQFMPMFYDVFPYHLKKLTNSRNQINDQTIKIKSSIQFSSIGLKTNVRFFRLKAYSCFVRFLTSIEFKMLSLCIGSSILIFLNLPEATNIDILIFCLSASKCNFYLPIALDSEMFFLDFFYIISIGWLHLRQTNFVALLQTFWKNSILVSIFAYLFEGIFQLFSIFRQTTSWQQKEVG